MNHIPDRVISATLINLTTNEQHQLRSKPGSYCLFDQKFQYDCFEIRFRIDWKALDMNGDPTLDADFYNPGETKPTKRREPAHHTNKKFDPEKNILCYTFEFEELKLHLLLKVTCHTGLKMDAFLTKE